MQVPATAHPALAAFQTRDIDEARAHMEGVFRSHRLETRRDTALAFQHEHLKSGPLSLHWLSYGSGVTMRAPQMDRFYLFQFTLEGGCAVEHGRDAAFVESGHGYAVDPAQPLSKTWEQSCRQLILRVERDRFDAFAGRETGVDCCGRLAFEFRPMATEPHQAGLVGIARSLRSARVAGIGLRHARVAPHLETTLLSLLLASFPHNLKESFDRAAPACAPFYVKRAETYIRANARDPLALEKLAAVAGVSTRSLFAGFRRFRDTTPMAYLKAVRLDLAKADLEKADPAEATVTDIAVNCGFTHMSKFARDFKVRFGVAPSAMLGHRP